MYIYIYIYIYIYDISNLSVNTSAHCSGRKQVKGTLKATYDMYVKEGFGNGASLSLYRLCVGNMEEGLLY